MISSSIQAIKTRADELAALGKPLDHEDLIEKILEGIGDDFQLFIDAVNRPIPRYPLMNFMRN